ncbi:MAG: SRPBCC domain-containing protein [Bacteroidota bacterium]|nr:SRPBCC domain-containing protein [Bacteroidota bacterium]
MSNSILDIKVALKIQKPLHEVFEAIVDPSKMSNYFIKKSSGRIEEGKTLIWSFPEFDLEFPVRIDKVDRDSYISFFWDGPDKTETRVEITLSLKEDDSTFVTITEKSKPNNEAGIEWLKGNTMGWANFLACLKAYLEYGINLRKGAFDISQMPETK